MIAAQLQTQVSTDELLRAAQQLDGLEFDQLLNRLLTIRAQRKAQALPQQEVELLLAINRKIPVELQSRYDLLAQKRQDETLTGVEYQELLNLTDRIEELQVKRAESLSLLAQRRGSPLGHVLRDLGIQPLPYV